MADTWTAQDLQERLGQVGVVPELVVQVRVTGLDQDPSSTQDRVRTRRLLLAAGATVIRAFVVIAALRQALLKDVTHGSVLLVVLLVGQVALRGFDGPSIMGAPACGSEAHRFVTALRTPTAVVRSVRSVRKRWLVVVDAGRQLVVTQDKGWSTVESPGSVLEIDWRGPKVDNRAGSTVGKLPPPASAR